MVASSKAFSRRVEVVLAILTVTLLMMPSLVQIIDDSSELKSEYTAESSGNVEIELYTLYFAEIETNDSSDPPEDKGFITTEVPDSGGQNSHSALDGGVEFSTGELMSSIEIFARPKHGDAEGQYYLPVQLFVKSEGPSGSQITWDVRVLVNGNTKGSVSWQDDACNGGFLDPCGFDHEIFEVILNDNQESITASKNQEFKIEVSAEMSGCDSGGLPGGDSCTAEVAWNEIDDESTRFSQIELETNAIADSIILVQRQGDELADGFEIDWYPNDLLDDRTMQFRFDVKSAFGRYDIESIRLLMRDPDGSYIKDVEITGDDDGVSDTSQGIFGKYTWTYPGNSLTPGEYSVELEIDDIQGNSFILEHESIEMHQYGVAINHLNDRSVEYFAPSETTVIPLQLIHRGASTKTMEVTLDLQTNLGSSWLVEFDSPAGYTLNQGGEILNPLLTITAPDDLTGTPSRLEIVARGEGTDGGVIQQVIDSLILDVEKLETYQPPMVSVWSEDHNSPYANSSRPDDIDSSIPRYVEYNQFNTFLLEIFNTGFDTDTFRVDVLQRSKSIVQIYDNYTGDRIYEDEGDGTFHIPSLERHSTQVLLLKIKPSSDREDPDIGLIELEARSEGNSSLSTKVSFTIQRTFGIRAEVSQDCDGTPLGFIKVSLCSQEEKPEINLRVRITNSMTSGESATDWWVIDPGSLQENTDRNEAYGIWEYNFRDENGSSAPVVTLGPEDYTEIFVTVTLTNQVVVGNHTIYLRIMEATTDSNPRYFDLPLTFEIDADNPDLEIVQISSNRELTPGEDYNFQLKVKNIGNSPLIVLLDAEIDNTAWAVDISGPSGSKLIELEPFSEVTFILEVTVPSSANNGEKVTIRVTAEPHDTEQSWPDTYTAENNIMMVVGINSVVDLLINEVTHPRLSTLIITVVAILLIFGGIQSRMNRKKWSAHVAYLEALKEEADGVNEEDEGDVSIPNDIEEEEVDEMVYEDDDIELV